MNLGFVNPALLWGLLAAAIPVAIHLFFRRRPRPTPFPAIDFILRARRETQRRLRLKKILLFTARTLLLAAIATAIARPRAEQPGSSAPIAVGPRATAIVLDASGSMRYQLGGQTLFERALADARDALASLTSEEPATVVVCGMDPPTAEPPSFDRAAVRRVLDRAAAAAGHSDLTTCVQAAAQALSASKAQEGLPKRIVVATDLAASAWRLDAPAPTVDSPRGPVRPEVSVLDAARGEALPNRAVVGLEAEPDPAAGSRGYKFTATLVNHGSQKLPEVPLSLQLGIGPEQKTAIRSFTELPAGGAVRKSLLQAFPKGGPAAVQVSIPGDALPLDDARTVVLDVPRDVRALVVDGAPSPIKYRDEAYFVESALTSAASPVRPHLVDAEALVREDLAQYDVVFLLNVRSVGAKAAELQRFVENGGGLFISVGDQVDPDLYGARAGRAPAHVAPRGEVRHPARGRRRGPGPLRRGRFQPPRPVGLHRRGARGPARRPHPLPPGAAGQAGRPAGPGAGRLRRRRARPGRGAARQGPGPALHLQRGPRLERLGHPHQLPPRPAALRGLPHRRPR